MIPIPRSDLIIGHQTHAGETGKNNEDRALYLAFKGQPGENGDVTLAVIADGIGGHRAGEVASQIAVNTFKTLFEQTDSLAYLDLFTRAFAGIQQSIAQHIAANPESEGMGTTCSVALIANRRLYTAFIGDSRIYLIRDGSIRQISVDHTWVQEAIEHGILTRQEARKHPNRHVVRRHLGASSDTTPDFRIQLDDSEKPDDARGNQGLILQPGDIVLLSSDGMTDLVEDHEILAAFAEHSPQEAVDALVLLARQRGGYDNVTVTAVMAPMPSDPASKTIRANNNLTPAVLGGTVLGLIAAAILLIALVLGAYFIFFNPFQPTPTASPAPSLMTPTLPVPTHTLAPITAIIQEDTPTILPSTATHTPFPTLAPTTPSPVTPTDSQVLGLETISAIQAMTQAADVATLNAQNATLAAVTSPTPQSP